VGRWPVIDGEEAAVDHLNRLLATKSDARGLNVLDAGCGERCALDYGAKAEVTGLDISAELLERNPQLDRLIVADLENAPLAECYFDVIVCWDVLEHMVRPREALDNIARALAPGGLLIVKVPNLRSVKGLATKYTPFAFHKWIYRRFAVSDGAVPFPTPFDGSIAPGALHAWAESRDLSARWCAFWEAHLQRRLRARLGIRGVVWSGTRWLVRTISLGLVDAQATDFVLVLERQ
jgi:SAM-dependent methyltransferase